ncbi:hypothetical protein OESDEN_23112 [Oesophagostomum dentatum]|uniref:Uncharacterized protein n=1 Tax=Oesophagostomum dentatum TaxID=61180 RepID=A0A0B1RW20_OESDE|nr:hypothetical protein OESDEN_23112 [Oesophagostomum dentatum]
MVCWFVSCRWSHWLHKSWFCPFPGRWSWQRCTCGCIHLPGPSI